MNWPHTAHNTRESPRYIFTIFTIILFFLVLYYSINFHFYNLLLLCKNKRPHFLKQTSYIYIFYNFCDFFFFSLILYFLKIQPLLYIFNLCFLVFVINFVPLRTQSSVPIFTWEWDHWLDCSLPLWTLLFLHQVTSVSSLPFLFSTQLCESLCVPDGREHLGNWLLAGSVSLLLILSSWPPLSPSSFFSSLYNSVNISEWYRLWSAHKEVITG